MFNIHQRIFIGYICSDCSFKNCSFKICRRSSVNVTITRHATADIRTSLRRSGSRKRTLRPLRRFRILPFLLEDRPPLATYSRLRLTALLPICTQGHFQFWPDVDMYISTSQQSDIMRQRRSCLRRQRRSDSLRRPEHRLCTESQVALRRHP